MPTSRRKINQIRNGRHCCRCACQRQQFYVPNDQMREIKDHTPEYPTNKMKFPWSGAEELAKVLTIGDQIEYRARGWFSFRATKWAICSEISPHHSANTNCVKANQIQVIQMTKNGEKLGTMTLEEFIGKNGRGRITNINKAESEVNNGSLSVKKLFKRFWSYLSERFHRFRQFVCKNRKNIFTISSGIGLAGFVISIAGLSVSAAVVTSLVAGGTLLALYFDPYHKRKSIMRKPSPKEKHPIAPRFARTPTRYPYNRNKPYRSL